MTLKIISMRYLTLPSWCSPRCLSLDSIHRILYQIRVTIAYVIFCLQETLLSSTFTLRSLESNCILYSTGIPNDMIKDLFASSNKNLGNLNKSLHLRSIWKMFPSYTVWCIVAWLFSTAVIKLRHEDIFSIDLLFCGVWRIDLYFANKRFEIFCFFEYIMERHNTSSSPWLRFLYSSSIKA